MSIHSSNTEEPFPKGRTAAFDQFTARCAEHGLLEAKEHGTGDDLHWGISDDGTLMRFLRARNYSVDAAFQQYSTTRKWRDANKLIELYDAIEIKDYEETRKMYTHWIGRRDLKGSPICLFEIRQLTPKVMEAYTTSCAATERNWTSTESEAMLRLFCTYENMVRFVMPWCSMVQSRPKSNEPITDTTCIVDITGVGLMQFWRLKNHMQAASTLATAHYPETLGKTYVLGAPSFFTTIWGWLSKWFDQNTISKICIVPPGQEATLLAESIHPDNIPKKYGGSFDFEFGMLPDLDEELKALASWKLSTGDGPGEALPMGPVRWVINADGVKEAVAVGREDGKDRRQTVMTVLKDS